MITTCTRPSFLERESNDVEARRQLELTPLLLENLESSSSIVIIIVVVLVIIIIINIIIIIVIIIIILRATCMQMSGIPVSGRDLSTRQLKMMPQIKFWKMFYETELLIFLSNDILERLHQDFITSC